MQPPPTCISVEAFLWHPHSIKYSMEKRKYTYNDQLLASLDEEDSNEQDDNGHSDVATRRSSSSGGGPCLHIELPPRLVVAGKHSYDLQKVAEQWAARKKYVIVAFGHVIACASSRRLLFVDFVMQKNNDSQGDGDRCYFLACVYYSQCRGGADLLVARQYMQQVQRVCNEQMQFFPRMIALCAYDGDRASAFFCSRPRTKRGSMMLGRFDIRKTAAASFWRRANQNLQPKVYAFDVTV